MTAVTVGDAKRHPIGLVTPVTFGATIGDMTTTPRTCDICNTEPATVTLAVMSTTAGWSLAEAADSARESGTVRCDTCWKYSYPNRDDYRDRVLVALPL